MSQSSNKICGESPSAHQNICGSSLVVNYHSLYNTVLHVFDN